MRKFNPVNLSTFVTLFAKTRRNDASSEIQIFAQVSSIYLKLCSVAIPMPYYKYILSYKARQQDKQHISFLYIPTAINITCI